MTRGVLLAVLALLAGYVAMAAGVAYQLEDTADEPLYLRTGRRALDVGTWDSDRVRYQGPFGLYFNQLFLSDFEVEDFDGNPDQHLLFLGRMGMVPFGVLTALGIFLWSRRLFGDEGGLLSLAVFTLHPLLIGYGALVNVDMAHAALTLLTVWALWRVSLAPTWGWLAAIGIGLGLCLGTKYLALGLVPCVVAVVLWGVARKHASSGTVRALALASLALVFVGAISCVALHGTYQFRGGFASTDAATYASPAIKALAEAPGVRSLFAALPQPFVLGLDVASSADSAPLPIYLMGTWGVDRWDYYLWCLALKTPDVLLLLAAVVGPLALLHLVRGRLPRPTAHALVVLAVCTLVPLALLSFFTAYKVGVRYILQIFPLGIVALGYGATLLKSWSVPPLARGGLGALVAALFALDLIGSWPNLIAYYNRASGGQAQAYRYFRDSNSEWRQLIDEGVEILREQEELPFEVLRATDGARFGRVAVYLKDLLVAPEGTEPPRHWLDPFEPIAHADAAWWLFEVTPKAFEAAANEGPEVVREELAVAYLFAGRRDDALRHAELLSPERARLIRDVARWQSTELDPMTALDQAVRLAIVLAPRRHAHLGCKLLQREDLPETPAKAGALARSLVVLRRFDEAFEVLEEDERRHADPQNLFLLGGIYLQQRRLQSGIDLIDRHRELLAATDEKRLAWLRHELELRLAPRWYLSEED